MSVPVERPADRSRLSVLLGHFATIEDPRDVRRISHPLAEVLLLVVCATMADCDDYDHIAAWGVRRTWTSCAGTCPTGTACRAGAG
jgi:DDE_Tnp_1-associated